MFCIFITTILKTQILISKLTKIINYGNINLTFEQDHGQGNVLDTDSKAA